jgi:osmotically inducible protein OsmC
MTSVTRSAAAVWSGSHKEGRGHLTTQSKVLDGTPYAFTTRFAGEPGTNPEELIAAAHAGCFNMSLAFQLTSAGYPPGELRTEARLTLASEPAGWRISTVALQLHASVPGIAADEFQRLAAKAKDGCAVSRSLNTTAVTLEASLLPQQDNKE